MEMETEVIVVLTPEQARALLDALPPAGYNVLGAATVQIENALGALDAS